MQTPLKSLCTLLCGLTLAAGAIANPLTKNGNMTAGSSTPDAWALAKGVDANTVEFRRDTAVFQSAPASLYFEAKSGDKDVSVYQLLQPSTNQLEIRGSLRTEGAFTSVIVAAQIFDANWKQLAWKNLTVIETPGDWQSFSRTISLPAGTARINLQLRVKGPGKVWMDDVEAEEKGDAAPKPKASAWSGRQPIKRVETSEPVVALTFDDGPKDGINLKMLDLFKQEGIHVTFFDVGRMVRKYPEIARRTIAEGHEIGSHSVSHPKIPLLDSMEEVRAQIVDNQAIIKEAIGTEPKVFRAPYVMHDKRMWEVLDELGLPSIGASIGTSDWDHASTVESITDKATLKTQAGDIVLMHCWSPQTLEALPEIIRRLRAKGLRFVTVSELLALEEKK
ncbi:polysaccharide deacetylase family protein [Coraliomargarita parva]|uniref:polysaccharide deacetylase family protein n=1 Tax=Coraliomargarita parva TaxID=3014050 RepID=UPI0022B3B454|nr:polysaccharide deacetylase family protein [Coraliomargarita parva]